MAESPVRLDVVARSAWRDDEIIKLTRLEFDLLAYLAARVGQAVDRREIMREVWGSDWGATKTLDMHISWLRRKLGDDGANPRFLHTIRGIGFRLEPGVVELATAASGPDTSLTRVVLIKPGDVLVFGNVGDVSERVAATAGALRDQLRLAHVVLFPQDIDIAAIPASQLGGSCG